MSSKQVPLQLGHLHLEVFSSVISVESRAHCNMRCKSEVPGVLPGHITACFNNSPSWVWWHTLVILYFQSWETLVEFKPSLGNVASTVKNQNTLKSSQIFDLFNLRNTFENSVSWGLILE